MELHTGTSHLPPMGCGHAGHWSCHSTCTIWQGANTPISIGTFPSPPMSKGHSEETVNLHTFLCLSHLHACVNVSLSRCLFVHRRLWYALNHHSLRAADCTPHIGMLYREFASLIRHISWASFTPLRRAAEHQINIKICGRLFCGRISIQVSRFPSSAYQGSCRSAINLILSYY